MKYNFICQFNHLCVGNIHVYAIKYRLTTSLCTSSNKFNSSSLSVVTTTRRCYIRQLTRRRVLDVSRNPKDPALTLGVFFISSKHWSTTSCAQKKQQHKWCCKSCKRLGICTRNSRTSQKTSNLKMKWCNCFSNSSLQWSLTAWWALHCENMWKHFNSVASDK